MVIIVIGAALIVLYRYHELGVLENNEFLQKILNKGNGELTGNKPADNPMVVYKKKGAASNEIRTSLQAHGKYGGRGHTPVNFTVRNNSTPVR